MFVQKFFDSLNLRTAFGKTPRSRSTKRSPRNFQAGWRDPSCDLVLERRDLAAFYFKPGSAGPTTAHAETVLPGGIDDAVNNYAVGSDSASFSEGHTYTDVYTSNDVTTLTEAEDASCTMAAPLTTGASTTSITLSGISHSTDTVSTNATVQNPVNLNGTKMEAVTGTSGNYTFTADPGYVTYSLSFSITAESLPFVRQGSVQIISGPLTIIANESGATVTLHSGRTTTTLQSVTFTPSAATSWTMTPVKLAISGGTVGLNFGQNQYSNPEGTFSSGTYSQSTTFSFSAGLAYSAT